MVTKTSILHNLPFLIIVIYSPKYKASIISLILLKSAAQACNCWLQVIRCSIPRILHVYQQISPIFFSWVTIRFLIYSVKSVSTRFALSTTWFLTSIAAAACYCLLTISFISASNPGVLEVKNPCICAISMGYLCIKFMRLCQGTQHNRACVIQKSSVGNGYQAFKLGCQVWLSSRCRFQL